jgi:hypothetical protein
LKSTETVVRRVFIVRLGIHLTLVTVGVGVDTHLSHTYNHTLAQTHALFTSDSTYPHLSPS